MHIVRSGMVALALLSASAAAQAQATAALVGRESVTHVLHYGGFAIVGSNGQDGSPDAVTALQPGRLTWPAPITTKAATSTGTCSTRTTGP